MECHGLLKLQVLSLLGFGLGATPRNKDKESTSVNIVQDKEERNLTVEIILHVLSCFQMLSTNTVYLLVTCAKILFPIDVSERHHRLPNIIPLLKTEKNINMWQPVLLTKYKLVCDQSILSVSSL